jgi:hypothetical protein
VTAPPPEGRSPRTEEEASPALDPALVLAARALQDAFETIAGEDRAVLLQLAVAEYAATGAAKTVRHPLGSITVGVSKAHVEVVDEQRLLEWALLEHPDEVQVVWRVREAFVKAVLARVTVGDDGKAVVVDRATGEVTAAPPGVGVVPGGRVTGVSVRPNAEAKAAAAVAVRRRLGDIAGQAGLALPPPGRP